MDLVIKNLSKNYDENEVLKEFSYTFKEGSFTCIMGKSGVGKSTLLSVLLGLENATRVDGIEPASAKYSAVFQDDCLCENLTALLNVKMVTDTVGKYSTEDIVKYFKKIGIDATEKKTVAEYSGGMKRRVAILRALLADYDFLVMDEPLQGLDEETKHDVVQLIKELTKGKTVIMTTHDMEDVSDLGGEILELK